MVLLLVGLSVFYFGSSITSNNALTAPTSVSDSSALQGKCPKEERAKVLSSYTYEENKKVIRFYCVSNNLVNADKLATK